jgi:general secretion pathway protein C
VAVAAPAAGPAPAVPLATRFSLLGVVSDAGGQGAALISVDGRPAKPFRVGSQVDEGIVLQSVQGRSAVLAASRIGPPLATLELPSKKPATAGPTTAGPAPASPNL